MNTTNTNAGLIFKNTSSSNKLWDISSFNNDLNFNESNISPTVMTLKAGGNVIISSLIGSGTRMVVADATGVLSTQAITGVDTTSLSNRINLKLNISDTASMLSGYQSAINSKQPQLSGTGFVKASGTSITYDNSTYYLASNPNGYTSNTGTVTSVATGLGLSGGTITSSGTLLVDTASASILSRQRAANTYATTSSLSGYLPLTGGTLTGALGGPTATFSGVITGQSNANTFGTASATGRAVIIQSGSTNQAIMFKNAAGGDGTLFINGTSTSVDYNFNTYSIGDAFVIKNSGNVGINVATPGTTLPSGTGWTAQPTKARVLQINSTDGNANAGVFIRQTDESTGLDLWSDNYFGDSYIELLEQIEYNEKIELINREGFWIKNTSNVNKHIMGRSHSQYHKDNIEYRSQQQKIRLTCDCGAIYSKSNKSRHEKTPKHLFFIGTEV
jgi:hypothetical protein